MRAAVQSALSGYRHGCVARGAAVVDFRATSAGDVLSVHDRRRVRCTEHEHESSSSSCSSYADECDEQCFSCTDRLDIPIGTVCASNGSSGSSDLVGVGGGASQRPAFLPIWHAPMTVCELVAQTQRARHMDLRALVAAMSAPAGGDHLRLGAKRVAELGGALDAESSASGGAAGDESELPYLLTGCDVVLTHEVRVGDV